MRVISKVTGLEYTVLDAERRRNGSLWFLIDNYAGSGREEWFHEDRFVIIPEKKPKIKMVKEINSLCDADIVIQNIGEMYVMDRNNYEKLKAVLDNIYYCNCKRCRRKQ